MIRILSIDNNKFYIITKDEFKALDKYYGGSFSGSSKWVYHANVDEHELQTNDSIVVAESNGYTHCRKYYFTEDMITNFRYDLSIFKNNPNNIEKFNELPRIDNCPSWY